MSAPQINFKAMCPSLVKKAWKPWQAFVGDPSRSGFQLQTRFDGAIDELSEALKESDMAALALQTSKIKETARSELAADLDRHS